MLHKDIYKTKPNNDYAVSFIVPFRLRDTVFFFQLLDCIGSNERKDFEFIFIDDGNRIDIAKLAKERIKKIQNSIFIRNDINHGVSFSRNIGIDNANGKYIMFIDSDDLVDFGILSRITTFLDSNNEDLYCFKFDYFFDNPNYSIESFEKMDFIKKESFSSIRDYSYFDSKLDQYLLKSACGKLFSRDVIAKNKIRFNEGLRHFEDYLFVTKYCSIVKQLCLLDGPTFYFYRNNPASASRSYDSNLLLDIKTFYQSFSLDYPFLKDTLIFDTTYIFLLDLIKNEYLNKRCISKAIIDELFKHEFIKNSLLYLKKTNTKGILNKYLKRLKILTKYTPSIIWKRYILHFSKKYLEP